MPVVRDVMTKGPTTVGLDTAVPEAARLMRDEDVGSLPIVEDERLVGIATDRDIVVRLVADGSDPGGASVRDIATTELVTVTPEQDLDDALRLMAKHQVRRIPVVEDDRLVGILAQADVAREGDDAALGETVQRISE